MGISGEKKRTKIDDDYANDELCSTYTIKKKNTLII